MTDDEKKIDVAREVITASAAKPAPKLMTKEQILQTSDREFDTVDVSQWWGPGMIVRVQSLTAGERDEWEASHVINKKGGDQIVRTQTVRASLVALSLVDDTGHRLFESAEVAVLQTKHAAAINKIYRAAADLSGVTEKDVEELAGN